MNVVLPRPYAVDLDRSGWEAAMIHSGNKLPLFGGSDEDGPQMDWTPEELLLSALSLCLMRTFETFARKQDLPVRRYRSRAEGRLAMVRAGVGARPGLTLLTIHVDLQVAPADAARARDLLVQAKQHCAVANALMPPVHLELAIEEVPAEEAAGALTCR
jgi:organic hydroperoxide reductase OsmC/OhrA